VRRVTFRFIPDAAVAAAAFRRGDLDLLRVDTPQSYETLVRTDHQGRRSLEAKGSLLSHPFARIRILIVNEKGLRQRGFTGAQIEAFRRAYSVAVDRAGLVRIAPGRATALLSSFPPYRPASVAARSAGDLPIPASRLLLLANNDAYSDSVAARLPRSVGGATIEYRAVDFGVLLSSLQKGTSDLVQVSLDATIDAPAFWGAFFKPGAPFVLFGKPLPDLGAVDLSSTDGVHQAANIINGNGNWIPLYREEGLLAVGPHLHGLRLTASGQESLESVAFRP
jgi:hypothetical protein